MPGPESRRSIQASSASLVTSTSSKPLSSACLTIIAIVLPDSVRLCGTLEMRLAPWVGCTMNSVREAVHVDAVLGAHARRPSTRDSFTPSRPVMS